MSFHGTLSKFAAGAVTAVILLAAGGCPSSQQKAAESEIPAPQAASPAVTQELAHSAPGTPSAPAATEVSSAAIVPAHAPLPLRATSVLRLESPSLSPVPLPVISAAVTAAPSANRWSPASGAEKMADSVPATGAANITRSVERTAQIAAYNTDRVKASEDRVPWRRPDPLSPDDPSQAAEAVHPNPLRNGLVPPNEEIRHVADPLPQAIPIPSRRTAEPATTGQPPAAPVRPSAGPDPVAAPGHTAIARDSIAFKVPEFRESALPEPPPAKSLIVAQLTRSTQALPGPAAAAVPSVTRSTKVGPAVEHPLAHAGSQDSEARPPFDAVKENGPIFQVDGAPGQSWPKPKLALLITGRQEGYFEPCGCAGLDRMKGGMDRRDKLLRMLRDTWKWPCLAFDVGGLAKGRGRQAELKFQAMVSALRDMNYSAIGLGVTDLHLPADFLLSFTASNPGQPPSPFVSANVGLLKFDRDWLQPYRVLEAAGMKIAVTGVLGKSFQKQLNDPEILLADPAEALTPLVPLLKQQKPDHMVLLAFASMEDSIALGKQFPEFDVVVTAGGAAGVPKGTNGRAPTIPGTNTLLIEVGEKTEDAIVLGFYADSPPWYQRVPLDSRFDSKGAGADPAPLSVMQQLMANYQDGLKNVGFEGLGLRPSPYPKQELLGRFVGSEQCKTCHEGSFDKWKKTPHSHAYQTLAKLPVPRVFDPECISCHVIGWDTQNFFPYQSGYRSLAATPNLINVGCESCHGPGERHIAAENGTDEALKTTIERLIAVSKEDAQDINHPHRCQNCHDVDNSPDFKFDVYFPKIEHHD
jgi:hypothetical protein